MRLSHSYPKVSSIAASCATLFLAATAALAQTPAARISAVTDSSRSTILRTHPDLTGKAADAGAVPDAMQLQGMTLVFSRTAAQQAALDTLMLAQQNPASPQYHQWLTPDQFAAQFGMAGSDLGTVSAWLSRQGFTGATVARSGDRISFAGSAAQFASAFGTSLHYFNINGEKHFAPVGDISVPAAIAPAVQAIEHVSDFRPKPFVKKVATPAFTSSQSGNHYMTPKDVATIYDVNAAYNAGYTGAGQSIAVIGQSAVVTTDITNFQTAAGLPTRAPQLILVPNTGSSTAYEEDESESDLDLEYSGAMGKGATIYFVYSGDSATADVFTALEYAITNRVAPIITISYGSCEGDPGVGAVNQLSTTFTAYNNALQEASIQGQTVIAASGDQGALGCYGDTSASQATPSANFPASSQYVTAVGGTEFPAADVATTATQYWQAATTGDVIGSALSYIPEMAWNDNSISNGLSAGGGGVSLYVTKPTWQTGVPGIPASTYRLLPDISLDSSEYNAPYLYCSSDASVAPSGGSCVNGFRSGASTYLTAAGGTSFAAPIFAGLLSVIEQKLNANGLGLLGPTLYSLASNPTTYASAFHDITSGTTACAAGSAYPIEFYANGTVEAYGSTCTTADASDYATGTGYDEATGLGSIDLNNLMNAWPAVTTLAGSRVAITAATTSLGVNTSDVLTVTVTPASGSGTPTGTVAITVDGAATTSLTLVNGAATYTFSTTTSGNHVINAVYSGNAIYAASTGTLDLAVAGTGTFTLSAPALTITDGNTVNETITITPAGGYTGTVGLTVSTTSSITNTCYGLSSVGITGTTPAQATLEIGTATNVCSGYTPLVKTVGKVASLRNGDAPQTPGRGAPIGFAMAGLLAVGLLGRRSKRLRGAVLAGLLAVAGFGLSGCGEGSTGAAASSTTSLATKGTYTVTIVATDSITPSISATTTFQLTIQ